MVLSPRLEHEGSRQATDLIWTWKRFGDAPSTLGPTPGVREAWHQGRQRYAVWVVRVCDQRIAARAAQIAMQLSDVASQVPVTQHHITLFVCGFPLKSEAPVAARHTATGQVNDDVESRVLQGQVSALQQAAARSFDIQIGRVNAFLTAPFLEVHDPSSGISRLRATLGGALQNRTLREVRFTPFLPHLTIAHFAAGADPAELATRLLPYRELEPLSYRVHAVELVDFCAFTEHPPFRVLARVELAG
jgi:2'-5' RNA ligase